MQSLIQEGDILLYHGFLYWYDGRIWKVFKSVDGHGGAPDFLYGRQRCRYTKWSSARFYLRENRLDAWRLLGGIVDSDPLPKPSLSQFVGKLMLNAMYGKIGAYR